ncbi:PAS domain S-box protein [Polaribacter sp. WD7]|uniref:PAS domain S-box protein n=1 Tax=Polaribacter sp. WD7 TaxID=2269061 RepID=UPI000DF1F624|nr:PAS domain S-box protein [Polaribacter sp. WD7]RCS26361.1 PAS domain S-box protein [Polaribacter sp. WD7]
MSKITSPTPNTIEDKNSKFKSLFEKMYLGVIYQDYKGEIIDVNPAALEILGLSLDQIKGKSSYDPDWKSIHENGSDYPAEKHPSILALKTGKPILNKIMGVINSREKDYRWIKINAIPEFKEGAKKPYQVFTTFDDISSLKRSEFLRKESENNFLKTLQNSANPILLSKLSDGKVVNFNDVTCKVIGHLSNELKNLKLSELNIWTSSKTYQSFFTILKNDKNIKDFETEFVSESGDLKILLVSGEIITIDNDKFILIHIEDITITRKTEEELQKQSNFAFAMAENHPVGMVACDANGKLVLFNKTAKKWHGIDVMKVPQEEWAEHYGLYKPDKKTLLTFEEIPLVQAFNNKKVINYEMVIKAKNQKPRIVICSGSVFFDEKGNKIGALAIMNDITHLRKRERKLLKNEQKIKKTLEKVEQSEFLLKESSKMAKVGAWDVDLITEKVRWSDQVFKIHGLPVGKIPSLDEALNFFVKGDREVLINAIQDSIQHNKKYDLELRLKNTENKILWINTIGYPITDEQDTVIGLRGVIQDITEQKNIRSKIEENREMHLLLANNTSDIICLQDADSTFRYVTPSVKDILGYRQGEFIGKKIFPIVHPEDLTELQRYMKQKALDAEAKKAYQFRLRHKKGNYVWVEFLSSPVYKGKKLNYFVTSARDITEWVLANQRIKEYQSSLQKLTHEITMIEEKQKKDIASNIHDHLSQSLVISKMKIKQLKNNAKVNGIDDDLQFIENHITDALEKSRKITNELSPPILYQLGVIEALYWLLENLEITHKIKFSLDTEIDYLDFSELKSIILYRSIQEILTNAIKHSKASHIKIKILDNDCQVKILVEDNGVGFDTSVLNNYKSHSGSGFGLFAIQEKIANVKGEFYITSKIQSGTTVTILIPTTK